LGLEVLDRLPLAETVKNLGRFVPTCGRRDDGNRLTDRLCRRISKHALGARIPRRDDPVQSLADDGIGGRIDDAGEQRALFVNLFAFGDVQN
jgi:hypothetical protein